MKRKMATVLMLRESLSLSCSLQANMAYPEKGATVDAPLTTMQTLVLLTATAVYFDLKNPKQLFIYFVRVNLLRFLIQIFIIFAVSRGSV